MNNWNDGTDYLMHYGIKGQKWGIRRYQNPDGTLTEAGKARYDRAVTKAKRDAREAQNIVDMYGGSRGAKAAVAKKTTLAGIAASALGGLSAIGSAYLYETLYTGYELAQFITGTGGIGLAAAGAIWAANKGAKMLATIADNSPDLVVGNIEGNYRRTN